MGFDFTLINELLSPDNSLHGELIIKFVESDTLAAVLKEEADWNRVPQKVQPLLRRCLERDPRRRLRDIGDAWPLLDGSSLSPTTVKSSALSKVAAALLALALAFAIATWAPWRVTTHSIVQPFVRLDLDLGPNVSRDPASDHRGSSHRTERGACSSPWVPTEPIASSLVGWTSRRLLVYQARREPMPFFLTRRAVVGFFAQGKLKKTRIAGGEPIALCDAPTGRGASWGEDGNIIAALDALGALSQVPSAGGTIVSFTTLSPEEKTHRWPQVLLGGKAVLFNASRTYGSHDDGIAVVSLKDHRTKMLIEHAGMFPRYLPSGHLIYVTKGTLVAVPFDPERLEVQGPATLLEEVSSNASLGSTQLD